jgi:hypothetical protein
MIQRTSIPRPHQWLKPHRRGATLVEVLMALLVMAIGVTSVFTLFPLALLKSIKANQLTTAKLYEGSIKDVVLATPQLITGAPTWQPNTQYGNAATSGVAPYVSRWVSPPSDGRLLPLTNEIYYANPAGAAPYFSGTDTPVFRKTAIWNSRTATGNPGAYESPLLRPNRPSPIGDANITWVPYKHSPHPTRAGWCSYIVDPLGWYANVGTTEQTQFGRVDDPAKPGTADYFLLDRLHCQLSSTAANGVFRLPDNWSQVLESTNATASRSGVLVGTNDTLTLNFPDIKPELIQGLSGLNRVVLTSTLVGRTLAIPVSAPASAGTQLQMTIDMSTMPDVLDSFLPLVDQARIEVQAPTRYSWLMAVQQGPRGELEAQAAVVFNRSFEQQDEQGYRAEFCASEDTNGDSVLLIDPDPLLNEDDLWPNGRIDMNMAKVMWPSGAEAPRFKEGGYILDASSAIWYQIAKVEVEAEAIDASDTPGAGGYLRTILRLNSPVTSSTGTIFSDYLLTDPAGVGGAAYYSSAVLMPGVVHVFPIIQ